MLSLPSEFVWYGTVIYMSDVHYRGLRVHLSRSTALCLLAQGGSLGTSGF
jgi:hypothetical protein